MSSLKAFEEATLWRPSLRPVKTTEGPKNRAKETSDVLATTGTSAHTCHSAHTHRTESPCCVASVNSPQFRTENFMMYGFKVALCSRPGRHKWDDCPFAHPTENARRRDPRLFSYSCHECPSYRNAGYCPLGDQCEYSHGVFEARLHPDSYRTVACKEGESCSRKICFFYHTEEEKRVPTGLHEARAQIAAELGDTAFDMTGDSLRAVANSLLTTSPSLSNTMHSLNSAFSQPVCHNQTVRSAMSMGNTSPLAATQSGPNTPGVSAALSGLSLGGGNSGLLMNGNSGMLMTSETVAPCLKGANRNKAKIRDLANEVGVHQDTLMNSLRVAALQGELTSHSLASVAPYGTFNGTVEGILEHVADTEEVPLDKLRGWLLRQTTLCPSPHLRAVTPSHRMTPSPTAAFSPRAKSDSPEAGQCFGFGSIRRAPSGINRASPSPTASAAMAHMGPVLPTGNDDIIRAFPDLDSGNSMNKDTWRTSNSKTQRDGLTNSLGRHKGSASGRWRGSATAERSSSDARW